MKTGLAFLAALFCERSSSFPTAWRSAWSSARNARRVRGFSSLVGSPLFEEAARLEDQGFVPDAIDAFLRLAARPEASTAPGFERAYVELRLAHLFNDGRGDVEAAERHLRAALRLDPDQPNPALFNMLGFVLQSRGDSAGALGAFEDSAESDFYLALMGRGAGLESSLAPHLGESWDFARRNFPGKLQDRALFNGTRAVLDAAIRASPASPDAPPSSENLPPLVLECGVSYGKVGHSLAPPLPFYLKRARTRSCYFFSFLIFLATNMPPPKMLFRCPACSRTR